MPINERRGPKAIRKSASRATLPPDAITGADKKDEVIEEKVPKKLKKSKTVGIDSLAKTMIKSKTMMKVRKLKKDMQRKKKGPQMYNDSLLPYTFHYEDLYSHLLSSFRLLNVFEVSVFHKQIESEIIKAEFLLKKNIIQEHIHECKKKHAAEKMNYASKLTAFMNAHKRQIDLKRVEKQLTINSLDLENEIRQQEIFQRLNFNAEFK